MRNLSAAGTIHSPIDEDRDVTATDFVKLGLRYPSPFDVLNRPRAKPKEQTPKKRGPKPKRTQRERVIASLEDPKPSQFEIHIVSRAERNRRLLIAGRGLS